MAKIKIHTIIGATVVGALGVLGSIAGITLGVKTAQKVVDTLEGKDQDTIKEEEY